MAFRTPPCVGATGGPLTLLGETSAKTETRDPGPVGPTFLSEVRRVPASGLVFYCIPQKG
jgi:hypothetical protein